jgi:hypothetical protein
VTPLERLALEISARISGTDLVLVLDYVEALKRETRLEALREALAAVLTIHAGGNTARAQAETALRELIDKETADGH